MTRPLALCVVCLAAVAVCLTGHSAEKRAAGKTTAAFWPGWRGPHRDDVSTDTGLLDKWPEGGPPLAWKGSGLGRGFSSVSIADGRIFTMGDREGGEFVIALGLADDGKELWSTRISDVWAPDGYAGPRCTPTVDGPRIYVQQYVVPCRIYWFGSSCSRLGPFQRLMHHGGARIAGRRKNYRAWDAQQCSQEPVAPRDALPEDDLVFFLLDLVPQIDLSPFHQYYAQELRGQPPFDVTMMVTLLVYAYSVGVCSSRRVAAACERSGLSSRCR